MIEIMISSSALIGAIALLRVLLRGKVSPHMLYGLWGLVALRLLTPWLYPLQQLGNAWKSRISVMNLVQSVHDRAIAGTVLEPLADNLANGVVHRFDPVRIQSVGAQAANAPVTGALSGAEQAAGAHIAGTPIAGTPMGGAPAADILERIVQQAAGIDWQLWIMVVWVLGSICLAGWMLWVNLRFQKHLRQTRRRYQGNVPLFVTKPVYVAERLVSPCYVGIGQEEAIYLPVSVVEDAEKTRHALAHETGHVMQHDRIWGVLRCGLLCLYWVNPLVWVAAVLSRQDCELSCDETAVGLLGEEERYAYGKTLVSLIAECGQGQALLSVATTMAAGKGTVRQRVRMLTKHPKTTGATLFLVLFVAGLLVACTFSGGTAEPSAPVENHEGTNAGAEDGAGSGDRKTPGGTGSESDAGTTTPDDAGAGPGTITANPTETGDEAANNRRLGDGDELVLVEEKQWGNYYQLVFQRRDAADQTPLPVKVHIDTEKDEKRLELIACADTQGKLIKGDGRPGMGYGYGYSGNRGENSSEFSIDFWNLEGAPSYRIDILDGEDRLSCQYVTKDAEPVARYGRNGQIIRGQKDTQVELMGVTLYSNGVWLQMQGRTAEEAQQFAQDNVVTLMLEGEGIVAERRGPHPYVGGQDGTDINLFYQFQEDTFPKAVLKGFLAGKGAVSEQIETVLDEYQMHQNVQAFVDAYMARDMETARRYSTMSGRELNPDHVMSQAPDMPTTLNLSKDPGDFVTTAIASYRFYAVGDTDSYSYLSMEVEKIDGNWKVTEAGFEK